MTVLEYVTLSNINEFYCETDTTIVLTHTHKTRKKKEIKVSENFYRTNLCYLENWEEYQCFYNFANKEIVRIGTRYDGIPVFYVRFHDEDWKKEIERIFHDDKRDYNYYIDLETTR